MSFTVPKAAGAAVLALAASALTLPLAPAALAATPVEKAFVMVDTDDDDFFGLSTQPTPTGSLTSVVPESLPVDVHDVSSSADGSRVIYVQTNFSTTTFEATSEQVVVRDVSTRTVRVLQTLPYDGTHFLGNPALSPNGTNAVWDLYDDSGPSVNLIKAAVGSGSATTRALGLTPYGFLSATTVLAQDINGNAVTLELSGGGTHTVPSLDPDAVNVAISPDLQHLAFGLYDTSVPAGDPAVAPMHVADVALVGGVATVSGERSIASGLYNRQPSFSRDGATVYWIRNDGTGLDGDIWVASFDGTTTPAHATAVTDLVNEEDVAIAWTDDGAAPAALPSVSPAVLKGTQATLDWSLPADADLSGTVIRRFLNPEALGSPEMVVYLPAQVHTFTDAGLTLGTDYTYTLTPVDRSGHYGTGTTLTLTALLAAPTFADPISRTSTTTTFPVVFGPYRSPSAVFTVDYFGTGDAGWTNWVTDYPGRAGNFAGVAGKSYTFRVQVKDGHGNASPLVNSARAVVPFDQTKATFTNGANVYTSAAYLGSLRKLWHTTDVARVTLTGNRLQVVGSTCGTCGVFDIYDNGTWVAGVSTYGSVTRLRQVLFTKYYSGIGTHSFAIKPRGTAGHPDVMLDGFAMRT